MNVMSKFVTDMEQGKMLELVILTHDGDFWEAWKRLILLEKHLNLGFG